MGEVLRARPAATVDVVAALRDAFAPFAAGADRVDVDRASLWLLQAELLGLREFGVEMLRRDLARLAEAGTATDASAAAAHEAPVRGAAASIDASSTPGILALAAAVRVASERAGAGGAAIVGIRGAGAMGVLGCAARSLAATGAVGIVAAQAPAAVAPWGASAPVIGTNPLAVAVPRAEASPLVVDYATSPVTLAAVRRARAEGAALRDGIAVDREGRPTTEAAELGAILPESLLGSLTGLVVELVAGVAVGGRTAAARQPQTRGAVVIAFDPVATGAGDAAGAATRLGSDWAQAGGHVPARFDALPDALDGLPATIELSRDAADWLSSRSTGAAR
jgi:LDH2 family malate/lactate/ureidoglycolate dehydrogenase